LTIEAVVRLAKVQKSTLEFLYVSIQGSGNG